MAGSPDGPSPALLARVPGVEESGAFLAAHSRSFAFAGRLFPPGDAARVARVYAWCRVTDDLVDEADSPAEADALLEEWTLLSARAYRGGAVAVPLLEAVMEEMARGGVPFRYAADLVRGMRMDLRGQRYETLADLRRYIWRVASVVGLWLTRLQGVHEPAVLERAGRMGHAMQLTNIARDVGEDLDLGRVYLPVRMLARHGLEPACLEAMRADGRIVPGYRALVEELLQAAETDYEVALPALTELPVRFALPVAVAAHVYRGIHDAIRRNGYDNLRRRAWTSRRRKGVLAARAVVRLLRDAAGTRAPGPPRP